MITTTTTTAAAVAVLELELDDSDSIGRSRCDQQSDNIETNFLKVKLCF